MRLMATVDKVVNMDEKILQSLLERMDALEKKVAELSYKKPRRSTRLKYVPSISITSSFIARYYHPSMNTSTKLFEKVKGYNGYKGIKITKNTVRRLFPVLKNKNELARYIERYPDEEFPDQRFPPRSY